MDIEVSKDKKTLTITIDLTKSLGISKSGKSILLASTNGSKKIDGIDATLGLNLFKPNPDYVKPGKDEDEE